MNIVQMPIASTAKCNVSGCRHENWRMDGPPPLIVNPEADTHALLAGAGVKPQSWKPSPLAALGVKVSLLSSWRICFFIACLAWSACWSTWPIAR